MLLIGPDYSEEMCLEDGDDGPVNQEGDDYRCHVTGGNRRGRQAGVEGVEQVEDQAQEEPLHVGRHETRHSLQHRTRYLLMSVGSV